MNAMAMAMMTNYCCAGDDTDRYYEYGAGKRSSEFRRCMYGLALGSTYSHVEKYEKMP